MGGVGGWLAFPLTVGEVSWVILLLFRMSLGTTWDWRVLLPHQRDSASCPWPSVDFNQSRFLGPLPTLAYSAASNLLWVTNLGIGPFVECVLIVDWDILREGLQTPPLKSSACEFRSQDSWQLFLYLEAYIFASCFWKVEVSKIWPLNQSWVIILE